MFPSMALAWKAFQKVPVIAPWVASEVNKVLMVRSWTAVRNAIRSTAGASPPHLGGRTRRVEDGTCVGKGRLSPTRKEKLLV